MDIVLILLVPPIRFQSVNLPEHSVHVFVPSSPVLISSDMTWCAYASWVEGPRSRIVDKLSQVILVQRSLLETQLENPPGTVLSCPCTICL